MAAISTVPLYTAQNPGWNYEALPYSIDDLPAPLPPRSEKLPWERKEALEKERQEHNVAETQKAYDEAARQKGTVLHLYLHSRWASCSSRRLLQQHGRSCEASLGQAQVLASLR